MNYDSPGTLVDLYHIHMFAGTCKFRRVLAKTGFPLCKFFLHKYIAGWGHNAIFQSIHRNRYRVSHYLLDTLHDHVSIVGLSKFHQNIYFTKKEGCPFNLNHLSSDYVSQVKSYNFLKNNF